MTSFGPPLRFRSKESFDTPIDVIPNSVSAITNQIKGLLETSFVNIWVVGEITTLSRPPSGHIYFNLKDSQAVLRSVMWRTTTQRFGRIVAEGQEVIVRGRISVYPPQGSYQFVVEEMYPKGAGAQDLALRKLKEKLEKLGYFAPDRKRKLPRFPRRIALVASPTGAAIRDMLEILTKRWPLAEIWIRGVRVQGDGSAQDIAQALKQLNEHVGIDAILLGRGGGSSEDLAAFNEEIVAQAIFTSRIPVVSAVGHEIDVTIADLVADLRAVTPSEAATLATPDRQELNETLRSYSNRLRDLLHSRYQTSRQLLQTFSQRRVFQQPLERLRDLERRLDQWHERLQRGMRNRLQHANHALEKQAAKLESLSPLHVLARGYSLTRIPETRQLIRTVDQVQPGDQIEIVLQDGRLLAEVRESKASGVRQPPDSFATPESGG